MTHGASAAFRSAREYLVQCALLAALLVVLFPGVFFHGEVVTPGGILYEFPPWASHMPDGYQTPKNWVAAREILDVFHLHYTLAQHAIDRGEWPLWNQLQFAGTPLLANCQSAVFYPPRLFHAVFEGAIATTVYCLLKLFLCGLTAYACGRGIGLGVAGARFLSLAWMLSGYNLTWCYWPLPDVAAWVPMLFWGADALASERVGKGLALMGIGATLMLLAGHPETAFALAAGVGVYFFLRLGLERRRGEALWTPILAAATAWLFALFVASAVLIPFFEYLLHSHTLHARAQGLAEKHGLAPGLIACLWVPRFYGHTVDDTLWRDEPNSNYVSFIYTGIAVWIGIGLLFGSLRRGDATWRRALCVAGPTLLFALLAFEFPMLEAVNRLPILRSMWPMYYISFPMFGLALLGAMGVHRHFDHSPRVSNLVGATAVTILIGFALAMFLDFHRDLLAAKRLTDYVQVQLAAALGLAAGALLLATFRWAERSPAAILFTALFALDLAFAARDTLPTSPRSDLFRNTELTDYLRALPDPKRVSVLSAPPLHPGFMPHYGIEELWGYDGIFPDRIIQFLGEADEPHWPRIEPLTATSHFLFPAGKPIEPDTGSHFEFLTTLDGIDVYKDNAAMPRAYLVTDVFPVDTPAEALQALRAADFDPTRRVVAERPPALLPSSARSAPPGIAAVRERTALKTVVDTTSRTAAALVLADAYYPGWTAFIDGHPAEVFAANYAFRGVLVPAGNHTVEFVYHPASFQLGLTLSALALLQGFGIGALGLLAGTLKR